VTWEAVGVIVGTLTVFAVTVLGLARLIWIRLDRSDRERRGDVRLGQFVDKTSRTWP